MFNKKEYMKDYNKKKYEENSKSLEWIIFNRRHVKDWRKNNPYKKYKSSVRQYDRIRNETLQLLGGKCVRCGYSLNIRALCIDHIHGNGRKHREEFTKNNGKSFNGRKYYRSILKEIKEGSIDYQCLCCNCNQIKKYENEEGFNSNTRIVEGN